ncbi:MAG: hypothetical protein HUU46_07390 [Candidatus Hydrogenedentes bacterium]|nr:hypothetical protein [Candidatus Hydrogenedentota bacterium]
MAVGRAKAVLTVGSGDDAVAAITEIIAVAVPPAEPNMFRFRGTSRFDDATAAHYESVLAPIFRTIAKQLRIPVPSFELSVSNAEIAAMQDRTITVVGYSADLPVFLACISAMLGILIEEPLLATGHIGSRGGNIQMVSNLPAKLRAACGSPEVEAFVYPGIVTEDASLTEITPEEVTAATDAIRSAEDHLFLHAARDLDDLLRAAFSDYSLILSSLKHGYFDFEHTVSADVPGLCTLTKSIEGRFWITLRNAFRDGETNVIKELLEARTRFHLHQRRYCPDFGRRLFELLAALPPVTRNTRVPFPLLPNSLLASLIKLVGPNGVTDVRYLLDAVAGDRFSTAEIFPHNEVTPSTRSTASERLDAILGEIDVDYLWRKIGRSYDEARQTFHSDQIIAESTSNCIEVVGAFLNHTRLYTDTGVREIGRDAVLAEAVSVLGESFARLGGINSAYAEARTATRGGLRFVLNTVVDHMKLREMEKHINYVFAAGLSQLKVEEQVEVIAEFIQRLQPLLPEGTITGRPSDYVENARELIQVFARASSQVKQLVRAM